jgi:glucosamine-6-phosphate deaminase
VEVLVLPDAGAVARAAADAVASLVARRPGAVLGLATGSSVSGLYAELVRRVAAGSLSLREVRGFLLDEYVGLPADHPQSYRRVVAAELLDRVDVAAGAVQGPPAERDDVAAACEEYEAAIAAAGGIDLQLLGIGTDGHLAFNEPGSSLSSRTRIKTLTARTRADNARFFDDPGSVPRHVLTQGLGTILEARHLLLLATGERKARAVAAMVEGPLTARCPASVLQLHRYATVLLDPAAAAALELLDYYAEVAAGKPAWQRIGPPGGAAPR